MSSAWLNPAGGLRYHVRGFRYANTLWSAFRFNLAEWLYAWEPPERKLVVVGSSAGYCFQPFFFERFDELLCLEPDPVARWLFERRLRRAPLETRPRISFESRDLLLEEPERLVERLQAEGSAALLFSNVVGQIRVLLGAASADDPRFARVEKAIARTLEGRSWASFHDRVSGPHEVMLESTLIGDRRLSDDEVLSLCYPGLDADDGPGIRADGQGALLDHLTAGFFPHAQPHAYMSWQLLPGSYHLVEATSQRKSGAAP